MARFTLPRDIYHGNGALAALKDFQGKRAVVCVGGGSMKKFGFLDRAVDYLKSAGTSGAKTLVINSTTNVYDFNATGAGEIEIPDNYVGEGRGCALPRLRRRIVLRNCSGEVS